MPKLTKAELDRETEAQCHHCARWTFYFCWHGELPPKDQKCPEFVATDHPMVRKDEEKK